MRKYGTRYCLKMAPKIHNNSEFTKKQNMFANCTVDGANSM